MPMTYAEVERLAGARLNEEPGSAPLPAWRFAVPRLDFVAAPGFTLAPSPEHASETNDYLVPNWPEDFPYRWTPGADAGNAEALYRLAVIRECQHRDKDALALHQRCAATVDKTWAGKSRRRIEDVPWLREASATPK